MRILLATHEYPPFRGGVARYCQEMAKTVARRGHEVTVVAPAFGAAQRAGDEGDADGFKVIRFPGGVFNLAAFPRLVFTLWRTIRSAEWDCIHLCDWPLVMAAAVMQRWHGFEFIVTIHGTDVRIYRQAKIARLVGVAQTLRRARLIVGNSAYTAGLFRSILPEVPPDSVQFAHLGVASFWGERPGAAEIDVLKERHGIDPASRCVISVARLDRRKGQNLTIQALGCLPADERARLTYLIVGHPGEAGYMEELKRGAVDRGVTIRFLAGLSDSEVRALVAGSEIFILPGIPSDAGKVEGFGLAYLEAAALGVPAIGARYAAVPEVVRDGETGLLVTPNSVPELAAAITELLNDATLLARLSGQAREFARQFTWEKCAEETYKIYPQY